MRFLLVWQEGKKRGYLLLRSCKSKVLSKKTLKNPTRRKIKSSYILRQRSNRKSLYLSTLFSSSTLLQPSTPHPYTAQKEGKKVVKATWGSFPFFQTPCLSSSPSRISPGESCTQHTETGKEGKRKGLLHLLSSTSANTHQGRKEGKRKAATVPFPTTYTCMLGLMEKVFWHSPIDTYSTFFSENWVLAHPFAVYLYFFLRVCVNPR